MNKILKNISLFSNSGIGEYGTNNILVNQDNQNITVETVIANELLEERANIFRQNYPHTNMIQGSIVNENIIKELSDEFLKENPDTGSFSPPCQGSSGLNAFKNNHFDFRNQLVKSIFQLFENVKSNNTLKFGYIENVVSYYNEEIPGRIINLNKKEELFNDYIMTKDGKFLNYQNFILTDKPDIYKDLKINFIKYELTEDKFFNKKNKKYVLAFNKNDIFLRNNENILDFINSNDFIVKSISILEYIKENMNKYGFDIQLKFIRGEEYGGCQIRQRGFVVFYKKNLNLSFPNPLFNNSKSKEYNGKTILDSLKILNLIEIIENEKEYKFQKEINGEKYQLMKKHPYKKINGIYYIDTSITEKEALNNIKGWNDINCPNDDIPNLHYRVDLKDRFKTWLENTPESKSAYSNNERHHRPYKIIEISKIIKNTEILFKVKSNQNKVIEKDTPEYFKNNNIIDYIDFVSNEMKQRAGEKEWGINGRKWQIFNSDDRKKIEELAIKEAKDRLSIEPNIDTYYVFMPIKGFEAATYKRAKLNNVSSALTTKNSIGNSNTCHPIFDRTWTVKEYMAIFGIGYILNDNLEYERSRDYIPPKGITKIKTFSNLLFEIHGEAIISTVAEQIMKSLIIQTLEKNKL